MSKSYAYEEKCKQWTQQRFTYPWGGGGEGVLPYKSHIELCHPNG